MWRSTALASVALIDAIQQLAPMLRGSIKWPNDVLVDGRKVAGILAESTWDGTRASVIVGVGVNVTSEPTDLDGLPSGDQPADRVRASASAAVRCSERF